MADSIYFNLFSPRGDPPPSAEMSNLSHHSNPCAKVCLQATEHEAPRVPTFSLQDSWSDGVQNNRAISTFADLAGSLLLTVGHLHYSAISSSA